MRRPVVGVLGSGSEAWAARAAPLGTWLARRGVHLLTGGGRGVMAAVSEAFASTEGRAGLVIGVLPSRDEGTPYQTREGYPNPWVEIEIRTHLPLSGDAGTSPMSRNHVNVLSADVLVALPGSAGTASELELALRYGRPVVAFLEDASEMPARPPATPVAGSLDAVTDFVDRHLVEIEAAGGPPSMR